MMWHRRIRSLYRVPGRMPAAWGAIVVCACMARAGIPEGYDPGWALKCALFSKAAYGSPLSGTSLVVRLEEGYTREYIDSRTSTRTMLWAADNGIIVAFKGTSDLRSGLVDAAGVRAGYPYIPWYSKILRVLFFFLGRQRVHAGFLAAYASVRDEVMATVDSLIGARPRPLYVTGHSLGGALATLAAYDIVRTLGHEAVVYTFGSPRVGNGRFSGSFDSRVPRAYRVRNVDDIVTALPPDTLRIGGRSIEYRHVRHLIQLDEAGEITDRRIPPPVDLGDVRSADLLEALSAVRSHGLEQYIGKLRRHVPPR